MSATVAVRALEDGDTVTHVLRKGHVVEMALEHAQRLAKEGVVEILSEAERADLKKHPQKAVAQTVGETKPQMAAKK